MPVPPVPLRIALDSWPGYAHAFLAEQKGLFAKQGVVVQLKLEKGPSDSLVDYKNGDVDGVMGVFSDAIILHAEGYPSRVIYVTDYSQAGDVIIGRPEYATLADLKGHTVGFDGVGSFSHLFVTKALESQGVDETTVQFERVRAMDVLQALEAGRIDAGHTWQPVSSQALAKGYKILAQAGDFPGIITDTLFVDAKTATQRPAEVQAVIRALLEAKHYLADHPEESLAIMAKATDMSVDEMASGLREIRQTSLPDNRTAFTRSEDPYSLARISTFIVHFLLQRGELQRSPNLADLIDGRFIRAIQREQQP